MTGDGFEGEMEDIAATQDHEDDKWKAWNNSYAELGANRMVEIYFNPNTSQSTINDMDAWAMVGDGFDGDDVFMEQWHNAPWLCNECGFVGTNGSHFCTDCPHTAQLYSLSKFRKAMGTISSLLR